MTVTTLNTEDNYVGDGLVTTFPITFEFQDDDQIYVTVDDVAQTAPADYSVVGTDVEFVAAPAASEAVRIYRQTVLTQDADYVDNSAFPAELHESILDKMMMIIQEQAALIADLEARVAVLEAP